MLEPWRRRTIKQQQSICRAVVRRILSSSPCKAIGSLVRNSRVRTDISADRDFRQFRKCRRIDPRASNFLGIKHFGDTISTEFTEYRAISQSSIALKIDDDRPTSRVDL
jgi:uncharacterized protein with von Willebrand factor type A (vWA) domain